MTSIPAPASPSAPPLTPPDPLERRLRAVHRAAAELKRGTPVLLAGAGPGAGLVVLPAETAGGRGLSELAQLAASPPVLLLAPVRAAAVLLRPVPDEGGEARAIRLPPALLDPAALRGLADPTAAVLLPQPPEPAPVPWGAAAALALAKIARLLPAVVAAPARAEAEAAARRLGLLDVAAADVLAHAAAQATGLHRVAEASVPLEDAPGARVVAFRAPESGIEHLAVVVGRPDTDGGPPPLVRLHSECFTGDLLGSLRCDCGPQLRGALRRMGAEGRGVLLYLAQEGRGIGLVNKLRAYALQDRGLDTLDANRALGWGADERDFRVAAAMLAGLGLQRVRLLTNNPEKVAALTACGIEVVAREGHQVTPNGVNDRYLQTKARRLGHLLD